MGDPTQLPCAEEVDTLGAFANAFRIMDNPGGKPECFLDFLLYSASENRARVVARIQVSREFLPTIRDRLDDVLLELAAQSFADLRVPLN